MPLPLIAFALSPPLFYYADAIAAMPRHASAIIFAIAITLSLLCDIVFFFFLLLFFDYY
jgi:hypothetical protein